MNHPHSRRSRHASRQSSHQSSHQSSRRGLHCTALAAALPAALAALAAHAQTPAPAPTPAPEVVVITGQAASTDRALRDQAAADNITSVVRADGIGRLPDKNVAEALQRLPGVSVERDQGEGRYVRIRGLAPDYNAVTLNGGLVPSPESDRRAVMLDVMPSALIRSLVVTKTLTPDQDANALGGTVDVQTLSAFDQPGRFLSLDLGVGYETNTDRNSPNGAFVFSDRLLDGRLGVAFGLHADRRNFGSDNAETGGAWDGDALEAFERRDYRITRDRRGAALNLEYRPQPGNKDTQLTLRALSNRYTDDEQRQAHIIEFEDAQTAGSTGPADATRELKDRKETQRIDALALGLDQPLGDWRLHLGLGASRSSENTPVHVAAATFEGLDTFDGVGFTDSRRPRLLGPDSLNDASAYALSEIELERTLTKDREHHLQFDLGRDLAVGGTELALKFGAKASRRTKTNEQTTWILEDFGDAPFGLSDAALGLNNFSGGTVDYPWGVFGPAIAPGPVNALAFGVDRSPFLDDEESTINDFRIREDIDAAYAQTGFDAVGGRWLVGLRYEGTHLRAEGTGVEDGEFSPVQANRRYGHWLPGVHLRQDLDSRTAVRAAWTNSVVRPTFGQLAPGFAIDGDEAAFGNPNLRPLKSANFDLGIERGLGYAGVVSAYLFHKRIKDFVYQTDLAGTGRWVDFSEAVTFTNGDTARLTGLELAFSRKLSELPAPWNGLLVAANGTFSQSKARIARFDPEAGATVSREIDLPSQSSRVLNLVLGYETPAFEVRLAANHKSRYLLEVADVGDATKDVYIDAQTQWDFSARYAVSKSVSLVFEALNLTNEPYYAYTGTPSRNAQYETYGRTYRLNLKLALN